MGTCIHGQNQRQCDRCEDAAEKATLLADLSAMRRQRDSAIAIQGIATFFARLQPAYGDAWVHQVDADGRPHIVCRRSLPLGTELYASPVTPAAQTVAVPDGLREVVVAHIADLRKCASEIRKSAVADLFAATAVEFDAACDELEAALSAPATPAKVEDDVARDGEFHVPTLEAVLRGLKSEDDSTQLRAIISEVQTMLSAAKAKEGS